VTFPRLLPRGWGGDSIGLADALWQSVARDCLTADSCSPRTPRVRRIPARARPASLATSHTLAVVDPLVVLPGRRGLNVCRSVRRAAVLFGPRVPVSPIPYDLPTRVFCERRWQFLNLRVRRPRRVFPIGRPRPGRGGPAMKFNVVSPRWFPCPLAAVGVAQPPEKTFVAWSLVGGPGRVPAILPRASRLYGGRGVPCPNSGR